MNRNMQPKIHRSATTYSVQNSISDTLSGRPSFPLFEPEAFPNVAAVQFKWAKVEEEQTEFVNRMTTESLETMLPFRKTQVRLTHLMQHLANHSTYHRGQIALMMRQLNAEPLATDFHVFLVEGLRQTAAAPANQGNLPA